MKKVLMGLLIVTVVLGLLGLSYAGWLIKREINYSFDYKDKVVETVHSETDAKFAKLEKEIEELKALKKNR